jgi:hypothetical protein
MLKLSMEIKIVEKNGLQIIGKKENILVNPTPELLKNSNSRLAIYNFPVELDKYTDEKRIYVTGPGEYEIGGVEIAGFSDGHKGVIFTVVIDGITIGIMGQIGAEINDKKTSKIAGVDVLVVNISGNDSVKSKFILKLAKSWGVNYLMPIGVDHKSSEMMEFLNLTDNEGLEPVSSLKPDRNTLPDGMEVVLI